MILVGRSPPFNGWRRIRDVVSVVLIVVVVGDPLGRCQRSTLLGLRFEIRLG